MIVFGNILLFGISGGEVFIVLLFILLFFGPKKIPEIARFLGKGINEIKKVQREFNDEINRSSNENISKDIQKDIDKYKENAKSKNMDSISEDQESITDEDSNINDEDIDNDLPYPYNQAGKFKE